MTSEQIIEIFIKAAETDRRLPSTGRPAALKAINHGYVHDTADMNGWSAEAKHAANWSWLDPEKLRLSRNEIGLWEAAMEMIKLCENEGQRRALWAWSIAKARGLSLAKWARNVEHIQPATAEWRAKAALRSIHNKMSSNRDLHMDLVMDCDLSQGPEISDKTNTVEAWRDEDARPLRCFFDTDIAGLEWAELQSAKRRERMARKRQAA